MPLMEFLALERDRLFNKLKSKALKRASYDADWGETIVTQDLDDDPGPINGGAFYPITRWIVLYRTAESGIDGTHNVTVSDIRTVLGPQTTIVNNWILKKLHIWVAPNTVSTHFSGVLYTKDDPNNGILGGVYSDVAPYGEFVKFAVSFPGEGFISDSTDAATKQVFGLGGSEKWNAVVYAKISVYN